MSNVRRDPIFSAGWFLSETILSFVYPDMAQHFYDASSRILLRIDQDDGSDENAGHAEILSSLILSMH